MKILVVDDDKLVAISLKTILEANEDIEVVATGNSGKEAIDLYDIHKPDILLMDIRMAGMDGLTAAEHIIKKYEDARILFLTTFSDDDYIVKALHVGAKGYILKQDFEGIVPALKAVIGGQSVFGDEIVGKMPVLLNKTSSFDYEDYDLNDRDIEIIELIAKGLNNKEVSEKLHLSEGTLRNYLSIILEKLDLRDRTQLVVFYYNNMV